MLAHPHRSEQQRALLRKRAQYFFSTSRKFRSEVAEFAAQLERLGETVAIGGFLRDIWLDGNRRFRSDVDFVVNPSSLHDFERLMQSMNAERNRFGGYSIQRSRWKVEVWPLVNTWAAVERHVDVRTINDLLKVTFFTWDSILYSVSQKQIIATEGYFDQVSRRLLDINLLPNPNPKGNAIRAIRYAHRWNALISKQLAIHIAQQIHDTGWDELARYERHSFPHPILSYIDGEAMKSSLQNFLASECDTHVLHNRAEQLRLQLDAVREPVTHDRADTRGRAKKREFAQEWGTRE